MRLRPIVCGVGLCVAVAASASEGGLPVEKVYGVNIGSWLVSEPWMFPNEWRAMGGEVCDDCTTCVASELYGSRYPRNMNETENMVIELVLLLRSWDKTELIRFSQNTDKIANAGLNTVRIPLGYWIIEPLVHRSTEFFPRGGLKWLKNGLQMLKDKGINVILDHHALPGVSSAKQMFAGRCTSDVQFYTPRNYKRALIWAGVMTAITHLDPQFGTVFAIEAINEPEMDYDKTPGLGEYEKNFVKVVRGVELALGIKCSDTDYGKLFSDSTYTFSIGLGILNVAESAEPAVKEALEEIASILPNVIADLELSVDLKGVVGTLGNHEVRRKQSTSNGLSSSLTAASESDDTNNGYVGVPHGFALERHKSKKRTHRARGISTMLNKSTNQQCLMTSFMNKDWQHNNPTNPADAAIGPQLYDAHLYFSFGTIDDSISLLVSKMYLGGVADPNPESYMRVICNTDRVTKATAEGNRPLVFGEWSLATNFKATKQFLHDWADAQRYIYAGQSDGWIFWNFKIEPGSHYIPAWSYLDALDAGYFTKDPSKLSNPNVCVPWTTPIST
ncbi:hypothetical protein FRC12_017790 [Ceratobasidium sp. 428]|nr:hypothetical protein FRC12_017790 [Ceratobasidium sp. 428]